MRSRLIVALALAVAAERSESQVTALSDLRFGTLIAGVPTSVTATSSNAGSWRIHFTLLGIGTSFQLTLPTTMARVGGGATLPVSFCTTCGIYRVNNSNPASGTTFNPANTINLPILVVGSNVYIWLGGTASPASNQQPGSYTAGAVLTLAGVTL